MLKLLRIFFWVALIITLIFAWTPHPPTLLPTDKSQHELAFIILTILMGIAYRKASWLIILFGLSALGAIIEFVQGIPWIHRDEDIQDWYADMRAILVGLMIVWMIRIFTKRFQSPSETEGAQ